VPALLCDTLHTWSHRAGGFHWEHDRSNPELGTGESSWVGSFRSMFLRERVSKAGNRRELTEPVVGNDHRHTNLLMVVRRMTSRSLVRREPAFSWACNPAIPGAAFWWCHFKRGCHVYFHLSSSFSYEGGDGAIVSMSGALRSEACRCDGHDGKAHRCLHR